MAATKEHHRRRNTILFSSACLVTSWLGVRYRQEQERKRNIGSFHVEPHRSGMLPPARHQSVTDHPSLLTCTRRWRSVVSSMDH